MNNNLGKVWPQNKCIKLLENINTRDSDNSSLMINNADNLWNTYYVSATGLSHLCMYLVEHGGPSSQVDIPMV
jgi:hypothetical protein